MDAMCISCGWVSNEASEERDVVRYSLPGRVGTRIICTECLEAASGAWILKSLPHSRILTPNAA